MKRKNDATPTTDTATRLRDPAEPPRDDENPASERWLQILEDLLAVFADPPADESRASELGARRRSR